MNQIEIDVDHDDQAAVEVAIRSAIHALDMDVMVSLTTIDDGGWVVTWTDSAEVYTYYLPDTATVAARVAVALRALPSWPAFRVSGMHSQPVGDDFDFEIDEPPWQPLPEEIAVFDHGMRLAEITLDEAAVLRFLDGGTLVATSQGARMNPGPLI